VLLRNILYFSILAILEMKLNLGCRNRPLPGFVGMDIDKHEDVDIVGDVSDLSRFKDNSIEEIYASHILEHFPHTKTDKVLSEWNRVIIPSGKLYIAVPDFARCVELYQSIGMCEWLRNYIWGDQIYKTAFHYCGFDEACLASLLMRCGFTGVLRTNFFEFANDCSTNVSNIDNKSVSLNMIGIK